MRRSALLLCTVIRWADLKINNVPFEFCIMVGLLAHCPRWLNALAANSELGLYASFIGLNPRPLRVPKRDAMGLAAYARSISSF